MRCCGWVWFAGLAFLCPGGFVRAQTSLDALEEALKEAKQQHQDVTSQVSTNFFTQVGAAMASSDAAVALYQQAGGPLPDPVPVVTEHENETETEREERKAFDQANIARLGEALQLHCGLMHFAALFVVQPDQKGLQDDWVAWLKSAAAIYPQLRVAAAPVDPNPVEPHKRKRDRDDKPALTRPPPFNPSDLKGKAMRDSIIGKFLAFPNWADKEQGGWSVQDLPRLYRANVLEPLRASPTAATLTAWDAYIALANADEPDDVRWNQVDYPPLQFDRACDDYSVTPSTEKLEGLVDLIKANPTAPQADEWITRVHALLDSYRAHHGGGAITQAPLPSPPIPAVDPNVTVTTVQKGDATIITTHTNSEPVTNAPPAP
jgi:hypothetical protein